MPKEPYNLFSNSNSTLPGGTAYDDMLVVVKGMIHASPGGRVVIPEELLMYVDKDEALIAHDEFIDGVNHKVFTIVIKERNQSHVGQLRHTENEEVSDETPRWARTIGIGISLMIMAAFWYLLFQVIRWAF